MYGKSISQLLFSTSTIRSLPAQSPEKVQVTLIYNRTNLW
jgi:hypothetical protein